MLTKEELKLASDAIRSFRFMMATAIVAVETKKDTKHVSSYMNSLAKLNAKLDKEIKSDLSC